MTNEILALLIAVGFICLISFLTWICCKIHDWIYNRKIAKQKQLYPKLYETLNQAYEINVQKCDYLQKKIEIKEKIDRLINEIKYATPHAQDKIKKELNDLRFELKDIEELHIVPLRAEWDSLQAKIKKIETELKNNGIKIIY